MRTEASIIADLNRRIEAVESIMDEIEDEMDELGEPENPNADPTGVEAIEDNFGADRYQILETRLNELEMERDNIINAGQQELNNFINAERENAVQRAQGVLYRAEAEQRAIMEQDMARRRQEMRDNQEDFGSVSGDSFHRTVPRYVLEQLVTQLPFLNEGDEETKEEGELEETKENEGNSGSGVRRRRHIHRP